MIEPGVMETVGSVKISCDFACFSIVFSNYKGDTGLIRFKKGVILKAITPQMLIVIDAVITVWRIENPNVVPVITSAFDNHEDRVKNTKHAIHQALDLRTRDILNVQHLGRIKWCLDELLGDGYDVVVEKDHIHVEYDPK